MVLQFRETTFPFQQGIWLEFLPPELCCSLSHIFTAYQGSFLNKTHLHFSVTLCVQPDESTPAKLRQEPFQVSGRPAAGWVSSVGTCSTESPRMTILTWINSHLSRPLISLFFFLVFFFLLFFFFYKRHQYQSRKSMLLGAGSTLPGYCLVTGEDKEYYKHIFQLGETYIAL